jgi:uncharacterized protein (TIGR04255 family)
METQTDWRSEVGPFEYPSPPLVEVLCEFGFEPANSEETDFEQSVISSYSQKYPVMQIAGTVHPTLTEIENGVEAGFRTGKILQFLTEDRSILVQITASSLTINQLNNYQGWENFKPVVLDAHNILRKIRPQTVINRLNLRYINNIKFQANKLGLERYFEFTFKAPAINSINGVSNFGVSAQYPMDSNVFLHLNCSSVPSEGEGLSALLDIELLSIDTVSLSEEINESTLDEAHNIVELAWLGCITEELHNSLLTGDIL